MRSPLSRALARTAGHGVDAQLTLKAAPLLQWQPMKETRFDKALCADV